MSGARGGQRSCLVHIFICKGWKIGAVGAMAPWIHYLETYMLCNTGKVEPKTFFLISFLNINFSTMFSRKIFFTNIFNLPNAFLDIFSRQFFFSVLILFQCIFKQSSMQSIFLLPSHFPLPQPNIGVIIQCKKYMYIFQCHYVIVTISSRWGTALKQLSSSKAICSMLWIIQG